MLVNLKKTGGRNKKKETDLKIDPCRTSDVITRDTEEYFLALTGRGFFFVFFRVFVSFRTLDKNGRFEKGGQLLRTSTSKCNFCNKGWTTMCLIHTISVYRTIKI